MAFRGFPNGVSDGLTKNRRFWRGLIAGLGVRGGGPPCEVIEVFLAHVARNRVEAAYARSDLLERRPVLMDDRARYPAKGSGEDAEPLE